MILSCHISGGMKNGKYRKLRSKKSAKNSFEVVKSSLGIEQVEIINFQYVTPTENPRIMAPRGLIL
ncbi:MAG: hypothetical protein ACW98A_14905 [Candidatus Hodarchaeales archaeon]|jgi:hypothetical protein